MLNNQVSSIVPLYYLGDSDYQSTVQPFSLLIDLIIISAIELYFRLKIIYRMHI